MMSSEPASVQLPFIPFSYSNANSQTSALRLLFHLFPEWEKEEGEIKFTRFTDGITNTLLKATKRRPGWSDHDIDDDAVLLRAYGNGTEIIIDRNKETSNHLLLAKHDLAPQLLARFQNGMLYRFIRGTPCSPEDLTREPVWRGTARRLAQWHAVLPIDSRLASDAAGAAADGINGAKEEDSEEEDPLPILRRGAPRLDQTAINSITPSLPVPNVWTNMQKWIFALPENSPKEAERKATLQRELERTVKEVSSLPPSTVGTATSGLVLSHCDLLSGNVVVHPPTTGPHFRGAPAPKVEDTPDQGVAADTVSFIDYEYAVPAPAAFDLANHLAEWAGFECEYQQLPTRSTRRSFLAEYLRSHVAHSPAAGTAPKPDLDALCAEVDFFRGLPGLYWGVWGLIQAAISQIDFDYASYAEDRLGEYWAWRRSQALERGEKPGEELEAMVSQKAKDREARWAEE